MTAPTVDSTLRMHRCLLLASKFVQRTSSSSSFEVLTASYPTAARDLADLTIELNALGYVDPTPTGRGPNKRRRARNKGDE